MSADDPERPENPEAGAPHPDASAPGRAAAVSALGAEFSELITHFRRIIARNAERVAPGLQPGAYKVLTTIARHQPLSLSSLVERMMLDKGQLSRSVRELEVLSLIERAPDPDDRRVWLLTLSELGTARLQHARIPQESLLQHTVAAWSTADVDNLTRLLHALRIGIVEHQHDAEDA